MHYYLLLVFVLYFFLCLLVLVKLVRKTPLRKPNCGEGIVSIKPRPKSV